MTAILTKKMATKTQNTAAKSAKKDGTSSLKTQSSKTSVKSAATPELPTEKQSQLQGQKKQSISRGAANTSPVLSTGLQLICTQNDLATHLNLVNHAVPIKPTHPILGNVLLVANQETQQVQLSVFDMNVGIQTSFKAKVLAAGEITIPVGLFSDIVGKFPAGDITLTSQTPLKTQTPEENKTPIESPLITTIKATVGYYQVCGLPTEEFPAIPEVKSAQTFEIYAEMLQEGIKGSLFAASSDETKQILTGVHLKVQSNHLELAATDGHRLVIIQTSLSSSSQNKSAKSTELLEFTIPAKSLTELERILSHKTSMNPVKLSYNSQTALVEFRWGTQRFVSHCLEGSYPAYKELLQQAFKHQVTLEKAALIKVLERMTVLADKTEKAINLHINGEKQQVSFSLFREFGNGQEEMAACINSGESLSISFNIKYLLDGVKAITSSEVQMHLIQCDSPAILIPFGNRDKPNIWINSQYLLMPLYKK